MLLTIYNLPAQTRYNDVKALIHAKCGLKEVILDNLTQDDNNNKKVTVGLAEEEDAAILVRKINGLFMDGQQLFVETVKKKVVPNTQDDYYNMTPYQLQQQSFLPKKPASSLMDLSGGQMPLLQQPYYQQSKYQPSYGSGHSDIQQNMAPPSSMSFGSMYGAAQNANYGYPQQMQYQSSQQQVMGQTMIGFDQGAPLGFSTLGTPSIWSIKNDGNFAGNTSDGNSNSQRTRGNTRWDNNDDISSRSRRDGPARDSGRERPSRGGYEQETTRDVGRTASRRDFGREAPTRDRGRDPPRDHGRDRGRDAPARDRGRDAPVRSAPARNAPGHNAPARNASGHNAPARNAPGHNAPARNAPGHNARARNPSGHSAPVRNAPGHNAPAHNTPRYSAPTRSAPTRRSPPRSAPTRENSRDASFRRPTRLPTKRQYSPAPAPYGENATNMSQITKKKFQPRDEPRPNQPWTKLQPKKGPLASNFIPPSKQSPKASGFVKPIVNVPTNFIQAQQPGSKKKNPMDNPEKMKIRTTTWRCQIASMVCKEIMKNPKHKLIFPPDLVLLELKKVVRSRLDEMFGDNVEISLNDMLTKYKQKYSANDDTAFFNEVREAMKADEKYKALAIETAKKVDKNAAPATSGVKVTAEKKKLVANANQPPKALPQYPLGDKAFNRELKKAEALIFQDEETILNRLKPEMQTAVKEEVHDLCKAVAEEFEGDEPASDKKELSKNKRNKVIEDLKKMLKINVAKRLLNRKPILLRIFNSPKVVNRSVLAPALNALGVTSLRKSDKKKSAMYFGTCNSYEVHDRLCTMEPIIVDGSTVTFKPFQLIGKPEKKRFDRGNRKNNEFGQGEPPFEELEGLDEEIDEDFINSNIDDEGNNPMDKQKEGDEETQKDIELNIKKERQDVIETVDNKNIKLEPEQEITETDNTENTQTTESTVLQDDSNTDNTQDSVSKYTECATESTEVENESTEAENSNAKPENGDNTNGHVDFTADVDISEDFGFKENVSFRIDGEDDHEMEKGLSQLNDFEDFRAQNIIDDIDMADLNDDDLEDW